MIVNNKEKFLKRIWLYRSILFKFTEFETDTTDKEFRIIVEALNIKSRYKRIYFVIDNLCNQIDKYYKDCNLCKFKNNQCLCHRKQSLNYINGCCHKCIYQSTNGCTTKNFACKMFNCSYVRKKHKVLTYKDLPLLKALSPLQRLDLKCDYFSSIDEVALDLFWGPVYSIPRTLTRSIKTLFGRYKFTKKA
ncbi:MAG: hypothetical protein IKE63_02725 [Bacilli bacterium]|nr:hypothetical protein [Bacilli bacterium]